MSIKMFYALYYYQYIRDITVLLAHENVKKEIFLGYT